MRLTSLSVAAALVGLLSGFHATYAAAATRNPWAIEWVDAQAAATHTASGWQVSFQSPTQVAPRLLTSAFSFDEGAAQDPAPQQEALTPRPKSFEYSHAYEVRRRVHVYASMAMLPLFVVQGILGQKLYDGNFTDSERTAHQWVAGTILGLFGMNTVTGIWNLKEGWADPAHHKLRVAHGLLMLGADAGFAATTLTAPGRRDDASTHSTHRAIAYTSVGAATAGYLIMLFGR